LVSTDIRGQLCIANSDMDPGSETNLEPDSGQTLIKNIHKAGNSYKSLFDRQQVSSVNFDNFPCSSDLDSDPHSQYESGSRTVYSCGSGSATLVFTRSFRWKGSLRGPDSFTTW